MTPQPAAPYDQGVTLATDTIERLEGIGYRVTSPRRAVLDAIAGAPEPFTVEDLCARLPGVGRATVFRTMKLLQELDVICRVPLEDGSVRYSVSLSGHHHHLICGECGRVEEFLAPALDEIIQAEADGRGFELEGHSVELYGRCVECRGRVRA